MKRNIYFEPTECKKQTPQIVTLTGIQGCRAGWHWQVDEMGEGQPQKLQK